MEFFTVCILALAWLCVLGGVVAICAAAGRADRH
jgi:hypothetical protein